MEEVVKKVKELITSIAAECRYYIVDITYKREGNKPVLRITADKEGGITMDECARFNTELSELLDKENTIDGEYFLEVCSPGLDRKLKKDSDFVWAVGKKVKVVTYAPLDGKKVFNGVLLGMREDNIVIDEDGISTEIPKEKIASARLAFAE